MVSIGPNQILDKGMVATTAIPLYSVVEQTDVESCALSAAGGDAVGICQEEVDADEVGRNRVVRVRLIGISRAVAAGPVALRDRVTATADGSVAPAAPAAGATANVVGIALTPAAAAGEWIDVMLTPGATVTG